jgi:hypothetical protein
VPEAPRSFRNIEDDFSLRLKQLSVELDTIGIDTGVLTLHRFC